MADPEDDSSGAKIQHNYLIRRQETLAVNKNDLEELMTFDCLTVFLSGLGSFFLSGATWLGLDKTLGQYPLEQGATFQFTMTIGFCSLAGIFGAALLLCGFVIWFMRMVKVRRMINETEKLN